MESSFTDKGGLGTVGKYHITRFRTKTPRTQDQGILPRGSYGLMGNLKISGE